MKGSIEIAGKQGVATGPMTPGRRAFIKALTVVGADFALGLSCPVVAATLTGAAEKLPRDGEYGLTAWVRIRADNTVTLVVSQAEIGQGISTTLPAIMADELGADWAALRLETAPMAAAYANPKYQWMFTGNSESIEAFYDLMRTMGAAAREMLVQAAAARWGVAPDECRVAAAVVSHAGSGRSAKFGELAADAAKLPVPSLPRIKPVAERSAEGRALPRVDVPAKTDGSAVFGIDFKVPGMLLAAVRTAPALGGSIARFDQVAALAQAGVRAVVPVQNGIAVVADTYWQARRGLDAANAEFTDGPHASLDSAGIRAAMRTALDAGPWATTVNEGAAGEALATAKVKISRDYENPFLAHATMEPMNCTARVTAERCQVWAPTQGQNLAFFALKSVLGLPDDRIEVNRVPCIGGGFGRRLLPDFVVQAALVSKAVGKPVKVIWDREEDMRHDAYRPATMVRLSATLNAKGLPAALAVRVVSPRIITMVAPYLSETVGKTRIDPSAMEGMAETRYRVGARRVDFHLFETPVPTSVLRTTGYGPNVFALESFIDELARAAKRDPYLYRRELLAHDRRALAVLDRAAALGNWKTPPAPAHGARVGRGIAFADAFGTLLAMTMEVEVYGRKLRVRRVAAALDCGRVLDPGIATSNIEGGIIFGLAGCLSEITFKGGRTEQANFNAMNMPRLAQAPRIDVAFVDGGGKLGGVGEISPVTVPAVLANALFSAIGKRIHAMPLARAGLDLI